VTYLRLRVNPKGASINDYLLFALLLASYLLYVSVHIHKRFSKVTHNAVIHRNTFCIIPDHSEKVGVASSIKKKKKKV